MDEDTQALVWLEGALASLTKGLPACKASVVRARQRATTSEQMARQAWAELSSAQHQVERLREELADAYRTIEDLEAEIARLRAEAEARERGKEGSWEEQHPMEAMGIYPRYGGGES